MRRAAAAARKVRTAKPREAAPGRPGRTEQLRAPTSIAPTSTRCCWTDRLHEAPVARQARLRQSAAFATYLKQVTGRGGANLRNEFVRANLRLVVTMARRYDRGGMPSPT